MQYNGSICLLSTHHHQQQDTQIRKLKLTTSTSEQPVCLSFCGAVLDVVNDGVGDVGDIGHGRGLFPRYIACCDCLDPCSHTRSGWDASTSPWTRVSSASPVVEVGHWSTAGLRPRQRESHRVARIDQHLRKHVVDGQDEDVGHVLGLRWPRAAA